MGEVKKDWKEQKIEGQREKGRKGARKEEALERVFSIQDGGRYVTSFPLLFIAFSPMLPHST